MVAGNEGLAKCCHSYLTSMIATAIFTSPFIINASKMYYKIVTPRRHCRFQLYWVSSFFDIVYSPLRKSQRGSLARVTRTHTLFGRTARWRRGRPSLWAYDNRLSPAGTGGPCSWDAHKRPTSRPGPWRSGPHASETCPKRKSSRPSLRSPDLKSPVSRRAGSCRTPLRPEEKNCWGRTIKNLQKLLT